jgi:hypothetical protein
MKKRIFIIGIIFLTTMLATACGLNSPVDSVATSVAATLQSQSMMETSVAATVTVMAPQQPTLEPTATGEPQPEIPAANTQCGHLSVFISTAIASSMTCQDVAENINPDGMQGDTYPRHDELTLTMVYPAEHFLPARIIVFPIARYQELLPDTIPGRVQGLQDKLSGGSMEGGIPLLPIFNAAQIFKANVQKIENQDIQGFRFLTEYAQYAAPINNHDLFYTFQGITRDGQYWVSVILPTTNPILPENSDNPPGNVDWETFTNNYQSYLPEIVAQLDALQGDSFNPPLAMYDTLVASITVTP